MPQLLILAAMIALSFVLRPKPKAGPKAQVAKDFTVPTAEQGKNIAVLFGTRRISGPNVVWYGDIKTTAIKK